KCGVDGLQGHPIQVDADGPGSEEMERVANNLWVRHGMASTTSIVPRHHQPAYVLLRMGMEPSYLRSPSTHLICRYTRCYGRAGAFFGSATTLGGAGGHWRNQ